MKKGFTLAETLIVLVVIGILAAILLPVARNIAPDRNLMKFKKAYNTLGNAIRELVQSEQFYLNGDLGVKINGDLIDGSHTGDEEYFCNTLAQVLNTKHAYCKVDENPGVDGHLDTIYGTHDNNDLYDDAKIADNECRKRKNHTNVITTNDGVDFYVANPHRVFGISIYDYQDKMGSYLSADYFEGTDNYFTADDVQNCTQDPTHGNCTEVNKTARLFTLSYGNFPAIYLVFCIDIDGINKGEDPFGYGIRYDGKIFTGARAQEWLEKE